MDSLRWILLGLGILVIVAVYLWTRWQTAQEDRKYEGLLAGDLDVEPPVPEDKGRDDYVAPVEESFEAVQNELTDLERAIAEGVNPDTPVETHGALSARDTDTDSSQLSTKDPGLPGSDEKVLVLYLVAPQGMRFRGKALREAFRQAGLEFGEMDIYHRLANNGKPVFSVANLVEPGTFTQSTMDSSETRGVSLFMRLPGPVASVKAFDDFSATARHLTSQLGGELRDECRSMLTQQTIDDMRESLVEFERKRQLAS